MRVSIASVKHGTRRKKMIGTMEVTKSEIEQLVREWVAKQFPAANPVYVLSVQTLGYGTSARLEIKWSTTPPEQIADRCGGLVA
jgi:hypothetical protein